MISLIATLVMMQAPLANAAYDRWNACSGRTSTGAEWSQCGERYIKEADAALNAEWKRLTAEESARTNADLLIEQRAWLAYRKVACDFMTNGDWGRQGQVIDYQLCVARLIERRTAELAGYRTWRNPG